jgi:hypothetical protein
MGRDTKIDLSESKKGVRVICVICGGLKKPIGRSAPLAMHSSYCEYDRCAGHAQDPKVGWLWPGESEADFGYPCPAQGTTEQNEVPA